MSRNKPDVGDLGDPNAAIRDACYWGHAPGCLHQSYTAEDCRPPGDRANIDQRLYGRKNAPSVQDRQVGGTHYTNNKDMQPWDIWQAFDLDPWEANAIKYLLRHRAKGGVEDLRKAIHYIEAVIEYNYDEKGAAKNGDPKHPGA